LAGRSVRCPSCKIGREIRPGLDGAARRGKLGIGCLRPGRQVGIRCGVGYFSPSQREGLPMKRNKTEFLLVLALCIPGQLAYAGSMGLPWFVVERGQSSPLRSTALARTDFSGASIWITGQDAVDFLLERLWGGSFVLLAHPLLYFGWLLLFC